MSQYIDLLMERLDSYKGRLVEEVKPVVETYLLYYKTYHPNLEVRYYNRGDFTTEEFRPERVNIIVDPTHNRVYDIEVG